MQERCDVSCEEICVLGKLCSGTSYRAVYSFEFNVDEFIKALTDAITNECKKSGVSIDDVKKKQEKEEAEKLKRIAKQEEENKTKAQLEELVNDIVAFFVGNKNDHDKIKPVLVACKERGYDKPQDIDSVEDAKAILALTL